MIKARKLTKRFGEVEALVNLNCNIPQGCIYGLVGANGAGKSTLARHLNGLLAPTAGRVCVGEDEDALVELDVAGEGEQVGLEGGHDGSFRMGG